MRSADALVEFFVSMLARGRGHEALEIVGESRWLQDPALLQALPHLGSLQACLLADAGDKTGALALLGRLRPPSPVRDEPGARATRSWLEARARLDCGQADAARGLLEQQLAAFAEQSIQLDARDAARLYETLSRACEAEGDLTSAMTALHRAQREIGAWVGHSARARLHALREAPDTGPVGPDGADDTDTGPSDPTARLVAQVAHQMRRPVSGMMGLTSELRATALDAGQRRMVELMQTSGELLMLLCNDLLDIRRLEAGTFVLAPRAADVGSLLERAVETLRPLTSGKSLTLTLAVDPGVPRLTLDPERLTQIAMNLLSNAIKFTPSGQIRVEARWSPAPLAGCAGELHVAVHDTGAGIDEACRARLFQRFVQLHGSDGRAGPGTGLGLSLCKSLIDRMGGRIGVDSVVGQGSTFWFTLTPALAPDEA